MSTLMSEQEHKGKRKIFTVLGIILVILGIGLFISGPILSFATGRIYLFFLSFIGVFFLFPGSLLLMLGTHRALTSFVVQSAGPVAVEATHKYGRAMAKDFSSGINDGFTGESSEKYCKYCGNFIDDDSEFCKYCGKKQN